ncbi:16842_t:CDS:2 [Rhizophagus irregularis]|nr:16842_t:CDS:2 [Rhizophagus irregularis]
MTHDPRVAIALKLRFILTKKTRKIKIKPPIIPPTIEAVIILFATSDDTVDVIVDTFGAAAVVAPVPPSIGAVPGTVPPSFSAVVPGAGATPSFFGAVLLELHHLEQIEYLLRL